MNGYDKWLESPYHENEDRDEYIDNEIDMLLNTTHNPFNLDNLCEAIGEELILHKHEKEIVEYLKNKMFEKLGKLIYMANLEYWENTAEQQAEFNYEND